MNWLSETSARVLVVGDAMVDRYVMGGISRISPEAPVPILLVADETDKPGGAANVAANVAAMGGQAHLASIVGKDRGAEVLTRLMGDYGVHCAFVEDGDHTTTLKTRIVTETQQIVRIDREVAPSDAARAQLLAGFEAAARASDFVILSDYAKGALKDLPAFLRIAKKLGKPTLVDPKVFDPERYRGAFILKPNALEFRGLFGPCEDDEIAARALDALRRLDIAHMIITRGAKGMLLVSADGSISSRPTEAIEVFDVSGAGDTVAAALAYALAAGRPIEEAVAFANLAAGVAVAHRGTYVVTRADLERRRAPLRAGPTKILSREALAPILAERRARGAVTVFTNGCFDVLHPGHVRMLAAARAEGDLLVVGLNTDASVKRLKGPTRPINATQDRAEVLAGLAAVDFVVPFDEDTPYELIKALAPDVLAKGADYALEDIVGADIVTARGGRVVAVNFHDGYSSTRTIGKIQGRADA